MIATTLSSGNLENTDNISFITCISYIFEEQSIFMEGVTFEVDLIQSVLCYMELCDKSYMTKTVWQEWDVSRRLSVTHFGYSSNPITIVGGKWFQS